MTKILRLSGLRPTPFAVLLLLLALLASPLAAQQPPAQSPSPATAELESLLATLENDAERQRFVGELRALVDARRALEEPAEADLGARLLSQVSGAVGGLSDELVAATSELAELPLALVKGLEDLRDASTRDRALEVAGKVLLVLLGGWLAERLVKRLLARPRRALGDRRSDSLGLRVAYLLLRTLLDILPILAFAAVAYGILPLTDPQPVTRLVALTLINANVLSRLIAALGRMILVPDTPGLRLLPMGDETASYIQVWLSRFTLIGVYGYFLLDAALLLGLAPSAHVLLKTLLGLVLAAMLVVLILQLREPVAALLRGRGEGGTTLRNLRHRVAEVWHVLAVAYVLGGFAVWALDVEGGFEYLLRSTLLSLLVLIAARAVSHLIGRLIERIFRLNAELKERHPLLEVRANRYLPAFHRVLNISLAVMTGLLILQMWGASPFAWLTGPEGRAVLATLFLIGFVILAALLVWEVFAAYVEATVQRQASAADGSQRLRTLLPLAQNALRILLVVLVTLIVLSEIGVNIAPLLAGAGVVGLAIGFGAQTLVRDVITGILILVEDSLSVGDVVLVAGHSGVVERLTVRSLFLRDLEGNVHALPFSAVDTIQNFSKEYSYSLIEMGVAYREDVDEVIAVMREVAEELRADEVFGANITGEFEVLGLDRFEDSAAVIRARFKTKPLAQWGVRREYHRRIKRAFDERGIEIPFPHQTLYFGEDKKGEAPPLRLRNEPRRGRPPAPAAPPPPEHPVAESPREIPSEVPDMPEPEEEQGRPA